MIGEEFLTWLSVPLDSRWLDVGCGTGGLSQTILDTASPKEVRGVDFSEDFISFVRGSVTDDRSQFEVADARELPYGPKELDAVVSGLALNFTPEPEKAVAEMIRVTRSGGTVAVYVFDYAGKMEMMRHFWDAAAALNPAAAELDEGRRFPICQPGPLEILFRGAGLKSVEVLAIDVPTHFRNFDDYWAPFLGGTGPAPSYATSLIEEARIALRERIREALPVGKDGSIQLIARAWAVRGTVPE
jgi:SAM-dependent methyltransferase